MYNKLMDTTKYWEKVNKTSGCWKWGAWSNGKGYGLVRINGKSYLAHRISYEIAYGEIPKGLVIDHICNNTKCVNPSHLQAITQQQNILRSTKHISKERASKKQCIRGHNLFGDNLYIRKDRRRACKLCKSLASYKSRKASL